VTGRFFSKQRESPRLAVVAAVGGVLLGGGVARSVGSGWPAAIGLGGLCGAGLVLWALDANKSWGNLGEGLLVSVVVAVVLLVVQNDADQRTRDSDQRRDDMLRRATESQNLRLTIGLRTDLSGLDLRGRPLEEALLAGKVLDRAYLEGAHLQRAILHGARLRRATGGAVNLTGADLTKADLRFADLSGGGRRRSFLAGARLSDATLERTVLIRADLRTADLQRVNARGALLQGADLRDADLRGANLTRANLQSADLRGVRLQGARLCGADLTKTRLDKVQHSASTRWPKSFDPVSAGLEKPDPALPPSVQALTSLEREKLAIALDLATLSERFAESPHVPAAPTDTPSPEPSEDLPVPTSTTIPTATPEPPTPSRRSIDVLLDESAGGRLLARELREGEMRRALDDLRALPPSALDTAFRALQSASTSNYRRCG
jgi:hypothetical protein